MNASQIIQNLPYQHPFLFVDALTEISENGISGNYTFKENAFFYEGHFKENPITPGVLLTETMAQIGVVCLGIYLFGHLFLSFLGVTSTVGCAQSWWCPTLS